MAEEIALIADDSQLMCDRLEGELIDLGFDRCIKVLNGEEAVRVFREEPVSITFLDIGMPGMDGLQTLQLIRSLRPDAYVVMASGSAAVDTVKTAIRLGAKGFMVKPYNSEKLREVVRNFRSAA